MLRYLRAPERHTWAILGLLGAFVVGLVVVLTRFGVASGTTPHRAERKRGPQILRIDPVGVD